ncbi:L,D-transpeptidase family protein [Planococcus sp. APC 4015]|nr:L,D-transpeptidase family protein [Planococcus sp. APC 4015]
MTDLATRPNADEAPTGAVDVQDSDAAETPSTDAGEPGSTHAEWAPAESAPKKRRIGMWIGIGAGVTAAALVATSLVLIAPGTSVAGVPVGFLTAGAATDAVQQRLAETTIILTGPGGDTELSALDLGATVDARGLADSAFADRPMWNVTQWNGEPIEAVVDLDADTATAALRAAAPDLFVDPVDASLAFDAATVSYVTTPSVEGTGVDIDAMREALQTAFVDGDTVVEFAPVAASIEAETPTFVADSAAANLNGILDNAGFYIGTERTVPVARDVVASWLTVEPGDRGTFDITADPAAIQTVVDGLAAAVDRPAVNATAITDTAGKVLREETGGTVGRQLGDSSAIASDYAEQLSTGNGAFELPVTEVPFTTTTLARNIVVDLSEQRTYLYENGAVVASYASSTGLSGSPTHTGSFRINYKLATQDMGCFEGAPYCTENVPWVAYFNGDQGFHGAYWHNNFGRPMSHGCVNLPVNTAKFVYDWAPMGTQVQVRG